MKLAFVCSEGFAFVGYQRVQLVYFKDDGDDLPEVARRIANIIQGECNEGTESFEGIVYRDSDSLFVLSGESLTLHDWVDSVWEGCKGPILRHLRVKSIDVYFKDGDEEEQKLC